MTKTARLIDSGEEVKKPYEAKPLERAALNEYFAKRSERAARPPVKIKLNGAAASLAPDHPDLALAHVLLAKAMGTTDEAFAHTIMLQIANASGKGSIPDEGTLNFFLSVIEGIAPRDQMEAMLSAQMAAVHCAIMTFARRLNHVENIIQQDAAERAFNKLARTFAVQMEALKRYRSGGEQKVTVQHVHVSDGGQAIVGNVAPNRAEGRGSKNLTAAP